MTPAWLHALLHAVKPCLPRDFVGRIEINVFKGGIASANVTESFGGRDLSGDAGPAARGRSAPKK